MRVVTPRVKVADLKRVAAEIKAFAEEKLRGNVLRVDQKLRILAEAEALLGGLRIDLEEGEAD